jgi:DNA polymerase-3 subunit epsilon
MEWNTRIHGIREHDVRFARSWTAQLDELCAFAGADVLVAHNAGFDMSVLRRACAATGDDCPPYRYLCSLQVSRKVYTLDSYRLPVVASEAGYGAFAHHDATADAQACAHIIIDAARRSGAADVASLAERIGVRVSQISIPDAAPAESASPVLVPAVA